MTDRDRFHAEGGCWCPVTWTLQKVQIEGHSAACTQARRGWEANGRHMSAIQRQRREDEAAGRQLREAAAAVLERPE